MRTIYLLRHGRPDFKDHQHYFLGRTDLGLSAFGKKQAADLNPYFQDKDITGIFSSTLKRSIQTAALLSPGGPPVIQYEGLSELSSGEWEGLSTGEVKEKYPALYAKRSVSLKDYPPPGGENFDDGFRRFYECFTGIVEKTQGNIILVCHAGVNRLLLSHFMGMDFNDVFKINQPYCGISIIAYEQGRYNVLETGIQAQPVPDKETCAMLLKDRETPEAVIAHSRAVTKKALEITDRLTASGYPLDRRLVQAGGLLHDIARTKPDHDITGAQWLEKEGYHIVADIVRGHHMLTAEEAAVISEKTVVYLADKYVSGERETTMEERFAKSYGKCISKEAKDAHSMKYQQALGIEKMIMDAIGE